MKSTLSFIVRLRTKDPTEIVPARPLTAKEFFTIFNPLLIAPAEITYECFVGSDVVVIAAYVSRRLWELFKEA